MPYVLCIWTSFRVLAAPESWSKHFFQPFFDLFCSFQSFFSDFTAEINLFQPFEWQTGLSNPHYTCQFRRSERASLKPCKKLTITEYLKIIPINRRDIKNLSSKPLTISKTQILVKTLKCILYKFAFWLPQSWQYANNKSTNFKI